MTIICAGGGTLGPVTPLLAVARKLREHFPEARLVWVGTPHGPEADVVRRDEIEFRSIPVAKFPRYLGLELLKFPWRYLVARRAAGKLLAELKPQLVLSVGGYMGVPLIKVANSDGIPCAIHQLDAEPGLANRVIAKLCTSVTTTFFYSRPPFHGVTSDQISTPCRFHLAESPSREEAHAYFDLDASRQTIFVTGGGTGAIGLNRVMAQLAPRLAKDINIIHLTGRGKAEGCATTDNCLQAEFFSEEEMRHAYAAADLVVARAGLGNISELAALSKCAILIPMPHSHQLQNVAALGEAVIGFPQNQLDAPKKLEQLIRDLLADPARRQTLGQKLHTQIPTDDGSALAQRWSALLDS